LPSKLVNQRGHGVGRIQHADLLAAARTLHRDQPATRIPAETVREIALLDEGDRLPFASTFVMWSAEPRSVKMTPLPSGSPIGPSGF
jgi:hypothetical protein